MLYELMSAISSRFTDILVPAGPASYYHFRETFVFNPYSNVKTLTCESLGTVYIIHKMMWHGSAHFHIIELNMNELQINRYAWWSTASDAGKNQGEK